MSNKRELCQECQRPVNTCYCSSITKLDLENNILIIRDPKEALHPFNTAVMAQKSLSSCQILCAHDLDLEKKIESFIAKYRPFLLFKNDQSQCLSEVRKREVLPRNFIVLDGTWKKAKRIYFENTSLQKLECLHLESDKASIYSPIRKACSKDFLSTVEAIALCLESVNNANYPTLLDPLKRVIEIQSKWQKHHS